MAPAYPQLTTHLDEAGTDGYLIHADGEDSTQDYLSEFDAMGDFITLYTDGAVQRLVPDLGYPRASTDSDGDSVRRHSEFDYGVVVVEHGPTKAPPLATAAFLSEDARTGPWYCFVTSRRRRGRNASVARQQPIGNRDDQLDG